MGVTGLWRLIDASGKTIPLETLEDKVLAIDISIWIHQVLQGYQDRKGNAIPNAHLIGLYTRICKLLFFKIKPVFVFDGSVPLLKKNTIAARKRQKAIAAAKADELKNDLLHNLMKHSLVKEVLLKNKIEPPTSIDLPKKSKNNLFDSDLFQLPILPALEDQDDEEETSDSSPRKQSKWHGNIHSVNVETDDFKSLPADVRYDILSDLKETRKQNSWGRIHEIPVESSEFASYQLKRLLKRRKVQEFLEEAEKEMGGKNLTLEQLEQLMNDQGVDLGVDDTAFRIAADDTTRLLYVNDVNALKKKSESQETQDSGCEIVSEPSCSYVNEGDGLPNDQKQSQVSVEKNVDTNLDVKEDSDGKLLENLDEYDLGDDLSEKTEPKEANKVSNDKETPTTSAECEFKELFSSEYVEDYTLEDDWDDESCSVAKPLDSPLVKKYFGQTKINPALTYMVEYSGLSQEEIATLIEDARLTNKKKGSRKFDLSSKKIAVNEGKDSFNVGDSDNQKQGSATSKATSSVSKDIPGSIDTEIGIISSDSDSDDFMEVQDVPIPTDSTKLEIVIDSKTKPNDDDIFADIFTTDLGKGENLSKESSDKELPLVSSSESHEIASNKNISEILATNNEVNIISESKNASNTLEIVKTDEKSKLGSIEVNQKLPTVNVNDQNNLKDDVKLKSEDVSGISPSKPSSETSNDDRIPEIINPNDFLEEKIEETPTKNDQKHQQGHTLEVTDEIEAIINPQTPEKKVSDRVQSVISRLEDSKSEIISKLSDQDELENMKVSLEAENRDLAAGIGKLERQAIEVTEQMREEAKELLKLFGIPFVVAPEEAEAQCAFLESINLTEGTVTDDSDIWLFGGRCVYRNFFSNDKRVLQYLAEDIQHHFKLSRNQMIQLALLVGSDYTLGIQGIGPVTAMEILAHFPDQGDDLLRGLSQFSAWIHAGRTVGPGRTALRTKLKNVQVDKGFPSQAVAQAYLLPNVDESKETFTWGKPNLPRLEDYTKEKFGWTKQKFNDMMQPIMKRMNSTKIQKNLLAYFKIKNVDKKSVTEVLSKRVQKAVQMLGNGEGPDENGEEESGKQKKQRAEKKSKEVEDGVEGAEEAKEGKTRKRKMKEGAEVGNKKAKKTPEAEDCDGGSRFVDQIEQKGDRLTGGRLKKVIECHQVNEVIPQREKDKLEALQKKQKAIQVFQKSKKNIAIKKKQRNARKVKKDADLSESSDDN